MSQWRLSRTNCPILIVCLILSGAQMACALLLPPAKEVNEVATFVAATLTALPAEAEPPAKTPVPASGQLPTPQLDREDFQSVLRWVSFAILQNQPEMIAEVIGNQGVQFLPYATGGEFLGYNNAEQVVGELKKGLENSALQCLGYNPDFGSQPEKAVIYFDGINLNWNDLTGYGVGIESAMTAFQFFRMDQGWELVYMTPVPEEIQPNLKETLFACPE